MTDETTDAASDPVVAPVAGPASATVKRRPPRSFFRELPFLVIIAFVLALLIKHFFVQAFYIPSGSMQQTLHIGDRVLVNKVPYYYRGPHRGEIVVFNGLDSGFNDGVTIAPPSNPVSKVLRKVTGTIGLGAPDEKDYIKRVIGIPGDHVMCCDNVGNVVVTSKDGKATSLNEPYVYRDAPDSSQYFCAAGSTQAQCPPGADGILVPAGRLWVMGDHRNDSADSRYHIAVNNGTVPENKVVGRAFTVVYPFGRFGLLTVPKAFEPFALPAAPYVGGLVGALPLAAVRRRRKRRPTAA